MNQFGHTAVVALTYDRGPSLNLETQGPPANQAVHPSGVNILVVIQLTVGFYCWMIANENTYSCKTASMWLTQPMVRLLCAGFLQLYVVLEVDWSLVRKIFELTG